MDFLQVGRTRGQALGCAAHILAAIVLSHGTSPSERRLCPIPRIDSVAPTSWGA